MSRRYLLWPVLCALGAVCLLAALAIDLDSRGAKVLMIASAVTFVPGALGTLAWMRYLVGPPQ
jgi:hypothetical protein